MYFLNPEGILKSPRETQIYLRNPGGDLNLPREEEAHLLNPEGPSGPEGEKK
jgi:hypothetical protein